MHTVHIRTAQIFKWWAEETSETEHISLWKHAWCPLLQGISRLSSHPNRQVRMSACDYLQRALLVPDLQNLTGDEWESCFTQVLFPLMSRLLEPMQTPEGLEETRIRAASVLSKVFLHHLTQLQTLPSFVQLWMTILDYMDKYMHADNGDLLLEAIPESLKNLLLVMDSANVFSSQDGRNEIWTVTWEKINSFLPNLYNELFKPQPAVEEKKIDVESPSEPAIPQVVPQNPQPIPRPGEVVEISGPTSVLSHQNWHPPAPIFPHMGQPISTPIGPSISSQVGPSISPVGTLPLYSGFSTVQQQSQPSHFFYQDI